MGLPWEDQPVRYPPVLATLAKDHETNWREAAHAEVVRARDGLADRSTLRGYPRGAWPSAASTPRRWPSTPRRCAASRTTS